MNILKNFTKEFISKESAEVSIKKSIRYALPQDETSSPFVFALLDDNIYIKSEFDSGCNITNEEYEEGYVKAINYSIYNCFSNLFNDELSDGGTFLISENDYSEKGDNISSYTCELLDFIFDLHCKSDETLKFVSYGFMHDIDEIREVPHISLIRSGIDYIHYFLCDMEDNIHDCQTCGRNYYIDWHDNEISAIEKGIPVEQCLSNRDEYERGLMCNAVNGTPMLYCCEECKKENEIKSHNVDKHGKQMSTERGMVYVVGEMTKEEALEAGFGYAFHSSELKCRLYSRCTTDINHREFVIVSD